MTETNRPGGFSLRARLLRLSAAAIAVLVAAAMMSGCLAVGRNEHGGLELAPASQVTQAAEKDAESEDQSKDTSAEAHPEDSAAASVGTPLTSGNWEVTVVSATEKKKLPNGRKPKKGNVFLLVEVRVSNIGTASELNVRPKQFWMTDANGEKIKPYNAQLPAFNAAQVRPILIGMGGRTTFVYQVPKGSTGYVFTFMRRDTAKEILHWQVP